MGVLVAAIMRSKSCPALFGGCGECVFGWFGFWGKEVPMRGYRDGDVRVQEAVAEGDLRVHTPRQIRRKTPSSYFEGGMLVLMVAKSCHGAQAERLRLRAQILFSAHAFQVRLPSGAFAPLELG